MNKQILYTSLVLGLFLAPSLVGAQYYNSNQYYNQYQNNSAQISAIQAQLNSLYQQLALLGYGTNNYNYSTNYNYGYVLGATYNPYQSQNTCNFTSDMSLGSSGTQVADLNRILGVSSGSYYDQNTYNAVVQFQNRYASEILYPSGYTYGTGYVGSMTRSKLNQVCNGITGSVLGASFYDPYYTNYNTYGSTYPYTVPVYNTGAFTVNFYTSPSIVSYGGSATLNWNTTGASTCNASGGWSGSKYSTGNETKFSINYSTTYVLTCYSYSGEQMTRSAVVTVDNTGSGQYPAITFYASPATVSTGGYTTVNWSVTNADSCTASGDWSGTRGLVGSESFSNITNGKSYVLTCVRGGNTLSQSATVTVH
ncbi:MAG TPA: hypothetical protein VJJ22_00305 [Candidatus Paceibacterota bacterium]